jgi:hypothetical protein
MTGTSGGFGGGLFAKINSGGDVSSSSMSLTSVTATNNTAGTMRWALLQQHDLWGGASGFRVAVCVRVRDDGGLTAVCEQYCVSRSRC